MYRHVHDVQASQADFVLVGTTLVAAPGAEHLKRYKLKRDPGDAFDNVTHLQLASPRRLRGDTATARQSASL